MHMYAFFPVLSKSCFLQILKQQTVKTCKKSQLEYFSSQKIFQKWIKRGI